jgi:D-methionine transport system ATP-binding protein
MQKIFHIDQISKSYKRGERTFLALDGVSLSVQKGDVYGIIGLSGAGKSTLIRCLASLVKPTNGQVFFHGQDIGVMEKEDLREFRKKIGMIFQHFNLLSSRTVAGNIAYPLEIAGICKEKQKERIDELLTLVGLSEKKGSYPSELSGGEKQRVGIARALANHPEVLLCDEATSALDPKTTREILALLRSINKKLGVTIVLITHEMDVIRQLCSKVAVIEKGKIVEEGPIVKVFGDPEHPTTKHFLQHASHEIPPEFFKGMSPNRKFLRLRFKGGVAGEPVMAEIVRRFNVDANILQGWIDRLQTLSVGTLIVELLGEPVGIEGALEYLMQKGVQYEVIEHEL